MKAKIDLEKFICSYIKWNNIQDALKDQGLKCWNDEIVEISQESDDEIKKDIVAAVETYGDFTQRRKEEIYAWLEKQPKQKPVESIKFNNEFENQVSYLIASVLNEEHEYNEDFVKYVAQSLLGYAKNELKSVEWSKEDEKMFLGLHNLIYVVRDCDCDSSKKKEYFDWLKSLKDKVYQKQELCEEDEDMIRYIGNAITCKESAKYLEEKGIDMIKAHRWLESFKPQLKQEWSEEDEGFFNLLLSIFTNEHPNGVFSTGNITPFYGNCVTSNRIITWIKSIKYRAYPKSEWGDDDEIRLNRICKTLWKNRKGDTDEIYQQEQDVNWLKYIKELITWKPSKKQIIALRWVLNNIPYNTHKEEISELLEQLNKLKGEYKD